MNFPPKKKTWCSLVRKLSSMLQRWWYLCSWLLITTTLLKAARPRSLHDMKPTLGTNKARFLQNRALVPISGLNACTYLPTYSKETLPLMNKLMELFSLFHMWIPPFTSIQNSSIRKQNVLAKSVERGRKFSTYVTFVPPLHGMMG